MNAISHHYTTDHARWQAVINRDAGAEGSFYYAVSSTGIYCRPTCPSKRPSPEHVIFFETSQAAEREGYRPCRRCRPNEVSNGQRVVARVQHLLETLEPTPTLKELGEAVALSPSYLQRLFKRAIGLSPKEYVRALRAENLSRGLKNGASVTEAIYSAGYGSSRALYEIAHEQLGMSPGAYKKGGRGESIAYGFADGPLGRMLIAATDKGVCALRFGEDETLLQELRREFPNAALQYDAAAVRPYVEAVAAHLGGQHPRLELPLDVQATAFQKRVWEALQEIPYGETRSYGEIARMIGEPTSVRAVARACAANPVALAIPCHRVVRAGGKLSGYRWGVERKRVLLERERSLALEPG